MDLHLILLVSLACQCLAAPYYGVPYQPFTMYLAQPVPTPWLRRPAVYAPLPVYSSIQPLVHNSVTYNLDPDAEPDDALEVAQFHSQDSAGRVVFGFNTPQQTRMEARALDGSVRGSYSYQDPTGKIVKMHYWDDGNGFHTVGNNLPANYYSSPVYTPEVQAARDRHLQLYKEALSAALASSGSEEEKLSEATSQVEDATVEEESSDVPAEDTSAAEPVPDYNDDSDSVAVESADPSDSLRSDFSTTLTSSKVRNDPEAARKQVAEPTDVDEDSGLAIARTGLGGYQYFMPVTAPKPGQSESLHATLYGAIPVDAVHDAQVSPAQYDSVERDNHQLKPVLLRTGSKIE